MRNTIKALTRSILVGTCLLTFLPAHATGGLFDSGCGIDGCWQVGAEAIWWKPAVCNFDFATLENTSTTPNTESILSVKPSNDWGFRVWVGLNSECDCYFLTLGWTYLKVTDSKFVSAGENETITPLFSLSTGEGHRDAKGRLRYHYNKVNLRGGRQLYRGCSIDYYAFAGCRWVDIQQQRQIFARQISVETVDRQRETSEFDGIGLELGVGGEYHIGCGFNLAGCAGVVAALGHQRLLSEFRHAGTAGDPPSDTRFPTTTHCVPGIELRLGFNYTYECGCVNLTGEIGYQLDYYYGALAHTLSNADISNTHSVCSNVGFGGLYAGLSLCF